MNLLEAKSLSLRFGGLLAIDNVSFEIKKGEILSVIGPNGAGKTSLFNLISGLYPATTGIILFEGKKLEERSGWPEKFKVFLLSTVIAILFVLLINAQQIWQEVISSLYIYQQDFSYSLAFNKFLAVIISLDFSWSLYPFLFVLAVCLMAALNFEISNKSGPMVSARAGISRTFQNLRLIPGSTVLENVKIGCRRSLAPKIFSCLLNLPAARRYEKDIHNKAFDSLKFLELEKYTDSLVQELPYGILRRVEIARAFASHPKLLMLDEPAAGLNPSESQELLEYIKKIAQQGITVLLIEHDMSLVMNVSDRIVVLHHGKKIAQGTPAEVKASPEVTKAYLGSEDH